MSYILEALKRAERERRAGSSSSLLDEIPNAGGSSATPGWQRWVLPAAISALAAAIVAYLIIGHSTRSVPAAVATAAPIAAAPQAAIAANVSSPPAVPPTSRPAPVETLPETAAAAVEDDGQISSLRDLDDKPAAAAASAQDLNGNGDGVSPSAALHAPSPTQTAEAPAGDDDTDGPHAITGNGASAPTVPESPAAKPGAAAPTENLREMPDDFRASFPAITVDVHAYAEDAAKRFVLIGGTRYHENDTLPQGPKIFAIVPEGIVFEWQGQRVLYALTGH